MSLVLRKLAAGDEPAFLKAVEAAEPVSPEFASETYRYSRSFSHFLQVIENREKGINLPVNRVPSTLLFGFVGPDIVGRLQIRHELNDVLYNIGGHIGYVVVPEYRRKGHATEMLRQSLLIARGLGLAQVLLTCDDDNLASVKTIEHCGGVFENTYTSIELRVPQRRYWIELP
jgi:predicted acetyltransferase